MKIKNILIGAAASVVMLGVMTIPALAEKNALGNNWRVYNVMPNTAKWWDINKPQAVGGEFTFPIQQFLTTGTGSFAVYFLNNYNVDMTDKTITTNVSWTAKGTHTYVTRGVSTAGAYVRLEFQDVTAGPYDVNDYWWSTVNLDLNTLTSGSLTAALADRTLWTNMAGLPATDDTTENYYAYWNDSTAKDTPYDGFTKAVKNVKQVGLSFGNASSYASGVALDGGTGTFTVSSFTIE